MEWYFELIQSGQIDVTPIITHRFPLRAYRDAFMTCYAQGKHGAVKVVFDDFEDGHDRGLVRE
jgi:threonine dehydrogenase-like Zn-dependent dehydrogenase